jgi:hypothetical protein
MPATVDIVRLTGTTPGTPSTITGINTRANSFDSHTTADTTSPVQIPAAGSNYSFWVNTRLTCSVTPAGTINNLRWYSDGANNFGTGITLIGNEATAYTQATGTAGQTGVRHAHPAGRPVHLHVGRAEVAHRVDIEPDDRAVRQPVRISTCCCIDGIARCFGSRNVYVEI